MATFTWQALPYGVTSTSGSSGNILKETGIYTRTQQLDRGATTSATGMCQVTLGVSFSTYDYSKQPYTITAILRATNSASAPILATATLVINDFNDDNDSANSKTFTFESLIPAEIINQVQYIYYNATNASNSGSVYFKGYSILTITDNVSTSTSHTISYHNGTEWVECEVYYHDGTNWVLVDPYYHNGSEWILCDSSG